MTYSPGLYHPFLAWPAAADPPQKSAKALYWKIRSILVCEQVAELIGKVLFVPVPGVIEVLN